MDFWASPLEACSAGEWTESGARCLDRRNGWRDVAGEWLNWIGGGAAVVTAGVAAWHLRRALYDGINMKDVPVKHIVANPDPAWVPPIIEKYPEIVSVGPFVPLAHQGDGPIVLEPLRDEMAAAERAWAATGYTSAPVEEDPLPREEERFMADWEPEVPEPPLRTDGPTIEEWVAAGYRAEHYPPRGWAPRIAPVRQPDTYILSRVDPNPGHIGNYPAGQWSPSKAASDGGGPGTYEIRAIMAGEEQGRSYVVVHPDGRVEPKS